MLKHSFVLIFRSLKRFASTFFINLIGLSTGLACALLVYLWVNDELTIDKFHENDSQLYQGLLNLHNTSGIETAHATPGILAESLAGEMSEVESAVATTIGMDVPPFTLSVGDKNIKASGLFAGKDFFNMFSYKLVKGDKNQVLTDKNTMVISEKLAVILFSTTENVVGRSVQFQREQPFVISGVFEDVPAKSSSKFDFVISFEKLKDQFPALKEWGNTAPRTFVLLKEGTDIKKFNNKVSNYLKSKQADSNAKLFFRPYSDKYLYDKYENGVQAGGRIAYVKLFSIIAIFILIIACINFMNLSTAKASRRLKEVGIKKAIGAGRETLVFHYLAESLVMAFLSLFTAVLLVLILLPQFNEITGKQLTFDFNVNLILSIIGITVLTGLVAGSYPALYLSGFNPVAVLKGTFNTSAGEVWARKGLVVFQFTISVVLIVSVLVVYKQIEYVQSKNLGYTKDNIISFEAEDRLAERKETFLTEVKGMPGVISASAAAHNFMGQQSTTTELGWQGKSPEDVVPFEVVKVDYDMIETLGIRMVAGRSFSKNFGTDTTKIIFNEEAVEQMGFKDPIGKVVNLWGQNRQIIGVAKNFHFESLHQNVKPLFFTLEPKGANKVYVRIAAGNEKAVVAQLEGLYKRYNSGSVLSYQFMDQNYQSLYVAEERVSVLSRYFAGLAIIISCLGLWGLASFTAERRLKEIGIRKIHGATEVGIIGLLTADFTKMILTAIFIALPLSYFITNNWLSNFNYRIDLEWWYFIVAGLAALLIGWLTVGIKTIKAARVAPIKCLKDE